MLPSNSFNNIILGYIVYSTQRKEAPHTHFDREKRSGRRPPTMTPPLHASTVADSLTEYFGKLPPCSCL